MSEFPPAPPPPPAPPVPPIDYRVEPPSAREPEWPAAVAWLVILATVAFIIGSSTISSRHKAARASTAPAHVRGENVQFEIIGKYVVGAHQLLVSAGAASGSVNKSADLMKQVDALAKSAQNKLQALAVAGELLGTSEAIKRLDALSAEAHLPTDVREDAEDLRKIYSDDSASLTESQRAGLIERHGFFGKLALAHGLSDSDPQRKAVLAAASRSAIVFGAVAVVGIVVGLGALVLLIIGIVLFATGTLRRAYVPQPGASTVYVEMFALYLVSFIALSLLLSLFTGEDRAERSLVGSWMLIAPAGLILPIVYGLLRGERWDDMRRALGWHGGKGWYIEIPLGIIGYIALLPLVVCGFAITAFLVSRSGIVPTHPIQNAPLDTIRDVLGLFFVASVGAPVIEETMFRGALLHHLRRRWGWLISASVVALIFAAIHPQGWTTIPALGSIALALAALREWRGSLLAPMAAHALNNGAVLTLFLLLK